MLYDKDIREPLFEYLESNFGKIRIIEEKQMGKSRADVVMVRDGSITGIEIKSDADTYQRLERQIQDYNRHFDFNYVVVGSSHAMHIEEHVPDWWGIITVDEGDDAKESADFYLLRNAKENPTVHHVYFRKRQIAFLWRMELAHIQELHEMPKYSGKSKKFIQDLIFEKVPEDILKRQITDELFERDYNTIADRITEYREAHSPKKKRRKRKPRVHV
ncbi:MAG: sce7726 family protein [Lachnospiraceae bacterium]|nr:sce7726 family protein [Lachnospiraceae bacterium]